MSVQVPIDVYQKLIEEDINVLNKYLPEDSLERKHIEAVLLDSIKRIYPNACNHEDPNKTIQTNVGTALCLDCGRTVLRKAPRVYKNKLLKNAELFTVKYWLDAVAFGEFVSTDGDGYWVKNGWESDDEVFSTPQLDATHVAWYNK